MPPLVSIIVPLYNEDYALFRCLDSILAQTFRDLEIILIDDGSTDGSPAICDAYAARDGRVRTIHQANTGRPGARNAGLDAATGKYIQFVDADDYIMPETTASLVENMEREKVDLALCGVTDMFVEPGKPDVGQPWRAMPAGRMPVSDYLTDSVSDYDMRTPYTLANKLFHRGLIEADGLRFNRELANGEDLDFVAAHLRSCRSIWNDPAIFYVCVYEFSGRGVTDRDRPLPCYLWQRLAAYRTLHATAAAILDEAGLRHVEAMLANQITGGAVRHCRRDMPLTRDEILSDLRKLANQPDLHAWLEHCQPLPGQSRLLPFLLKHRWILPLYYLARRRSDRRFRRFLAPAR